MPHDNGARVSTDRPKLSREHVRLFRADTPHDVAAACLVASQTRGEDYLAISADKAFGEIDEYRLVMRAIARAHDWADIVDITGLPIARHDWLIPYARSTRVQRYRDMRRSLRMLHATITRHLSPKAVDELFLTCLDHPDIQLFTQVMPHAAVSHVPHGLGCIVDSENSTYVKWTSKPSMPRRVRYFTVSAMKRAVWGKAATPPLAFRIKHAYSFNRVPAFGQHRHHMPDLVTPNTLRRLFDVLPADIRRVYMSDVENKPGEKAALLLLLPPDDADSNYPNGQVVGRLTNLTGLLVDKHQVSGIIVKPHPRGSEHWTRRVTEAMQVAFDQGSITIIDKYPSVPIEIVAGVMNLAAAVGVSSTSLQTLARFYDISTYTTKANASMAE